jgi:hypothetical protein
MSRKGAKSIMGDNLGKPPPAFIFSCERAGSTLLRYVLDTHPEICSPGQLYLGQLCRSLETTAYYSVGQVVEVADERERERLVAEEVRRIVEDLMGRYAEAKSKRMWCDKTTANLEHLKILNRVFPDARCVCLYRNCMDVVYSSIECSRLGFMPEFVPYVRKSPDNLVAAMAESWVEKTEKLLSFERENRERCFRVKYESLVLEPSQSLRPLFEFLGVVWDEGLLDAVFTTPHDQGSGDRKILFRRKIEHNSIGQGSALSREDVPPALLARVNELLLELDYPAVGPDWGRTPSPYLPAGSPENEAGAVKTVREVFESHFPKLIGERGERLDEVNAACRFVVSGEDGGAWTLSLFPAGGRVVPGDAEADCTVTVSPDDLLGIVNGKLNPVAAFDLGRLHVTGDFEKANKVGQFLFGG